MGSYRLALVLGALAAVSAQPALAGTAMIVDGKLTYHAGAGETNSVTLTRAPDAYRIFDAGAPVTAGARCTSLTPHQAECSARGVHGIEIVTGDLGDFATSSVSDDVVIRGGDGDDVLEGGDGFDDLHGDAGADVLRGGRGFDLLEGGLGADTLSGGTDSFEDEFEFDLDLAVYHGRPVGVRVTLDDVADDGAPGEGDNVMRDVEGALGGARDDVMIGNGELLNLFYGGRGADRLVGGGGEIDILLGGRGDDFLEGGPGFDGLLGGFGHDRAYGGGGRDFIAGNPGNDVLRGDADRDSIAGRTGRDVLLGGRGPDALFSHDGMRDKVFGGPGRDRGRVDRRAIDHVAGVEDRRVVPPPRGLRALRAVDGRSFAGFGPGARRLEEQVLRVAARIW